MNALELTRPLALLALALLPLIWWLQRTPARTVSTDRLALWDRALHRVPRARQPWLPLRTLLALVAFTLLSVAAAGLRVREQQGYRRLWCVIDQSASMQARDGDATGRTRAAIALDGARRRCDALPPHIDVALFGVDHQRIRAHSGEPNSIVRGSDPGTIEFGSPGSARLGLASALAKRGGPDTLVVLHSDGAGMSKWPASAPNMLFEGVGSAAANAGIVAAAFVDPWPGPELTVRLRLAGKPTELRVGDRVVAVSGAEVTVPIPRGGGGAVTVSIAGGDAFALDDSVRFDIAAPWAPAMLAMPAEAPALEPLARFLAEALGAHRAQTRADLKDDREQSPQDTLLLVDRGELAAWPEDGVVRLLFGTRLPGLAGSLPCERFPTWARENPLLRGLDLSAVRSPAMRSGSGPLPPGASVLARVGERPFLVVSDRHRLLWVAVDLTTSNLAKQPFLPILALRTLGQLLRARAVTRVSGLLDAEESRVVAVPPPGPLVEPVFWVAAVEFWPWLLAIALGAIVLRELLRWTPRAGG